MENYLQHILPKTSGIMLGSLAYRTNLLVFYLVTKSSGQKCLFRIKPQNQIFPQSKKKSVFIHVKVQYFMHFSPNLFQNVQKPQEILWVSFCRKLGGFVWWGELGW